MQKLITVYLDREGYRIRGQRSPSQSHRVIEEHLEEYLTSGWTIKSFSSAGAGGGTEVSGFACGWIVVLLEKT